MKENLIWNTIFKIVDNIAYADIIDNGFQNAAYKTRTYKILKLQRVGEKNIFWNLFEIKQNFKIEALP